MIKNGLLLLLLSFAISLVAGCSEVEDILGKVNQLLDEQLGETDTADTEAEESKSAHLTLEDEMESAVEETIHHMSNEAENGEDLMSDGHENEADPQLSFEERFLKAGYTQIDPPNGLMLPVPVDWVLVQVIKEEPWEGVFCFDTRMDETILQLEADFRTAGMDVISDPITGDSDHVHSTKYYYKDMNETLQGDIIYYADNYGTSCATVYLEIEYD